jgi:hypothetical protein
MAEYTISGRSSIVPTAARGGVSLHSIAAVAPKIKEIAVFNTSVTAFIAAVMKTTNATGVGSGLTEVPVQADSPAASCTGFAGHTSDPALGAEVVRAPIAAAIGAGAIWTFDEKPLTPLIGTANGITITCPTGTGQTFDYYIRWEE